jgi:pSer/pThr/pTyr-binding forkhead associated (FHA) protein
MWLIAMDQVEGDLPHELARGSIVVGRDRRCDVFIRERTLSRRHARITLRANEAILLEDLNSKNGTFVDEIRIKRQPLLPKAIIRLGDIRLFLSTTSPHSANEESEPAEDTQSARGATGDRVVQLPLDNLSPTQREVFDLMLQGHDEMEIAARLERSFHTVHNHVRAIFRTLGVHSRTELLAKMLQTKSP